MQHSLLARPARVTRKQDDLYVLENALRRHGFVSIGGTDEAGRGACAGPLVVAAVVLPSGKRGKIPGLADSKLLTQKVRSAVYDEVLARAEAHAIVSISAADVDRYGVGVANLSGMRRALGRLWPTPGYALTDGFAVSGLPMPALAVWKGDQVAASVAAASVLAKVTRDRYMCELDKAFPEYGFAEHKGYSTATHQEALSRLGPCPQHRRSYANVAAAEQGRAAPGLVGTSQWVADEADPQPRVGAFS